MIKQQRPIQVPWAMNEAYHYGKPSAFSRGTELFLAGTRLIFISGTASVGKNGESLYIGDLKAQARRMFENVEAVLLRANASWKNVVKTTIYLKDITKDYEAFNEVRCDYFKEIRLEEYPASTCVEAKLCREELLVEMELIAAVKEEN